MSRSAFRGLALPILFLAFPAAGAETQQRPSTPPTPQIAPPAPAIEAGERVFDRSGQPVGVIQNMVETPAGPMVVALIDGKLISLPQSTLKTDGNRVVSNQTKDQMVAAAGAPR